MRRWTTGAAALVVAAASVVALGGPAAAITPAPPLDACPYSGTAPVLAAALDATGDSAVRTSEQSVAVVSPSGRVLASAAGAGTLHSGPVGISADGARVVFSVDGRVVPAADDNLAEDVHLLDRTTTPATVSLLSATSTGDAGNGASTDAVISADGSTVAFSTDASDLLPGDGNGVTDIVVRHLATGAVERGSATPNGRGTNRSAFAPRLSGDGSRLLFLSGGRTLVAGDTNEQVDGFVRDVPAGVTQRVSVSSAGAEADAGVTQADLSASGNLVAFLSRATTLTADATDGEPHAFLRDIAAGTTTAVVRDAGGAPVRVDALSLAPDGAHLAARTATGVEVVDLTTGGRTPLGVADVGDVSWSPDGSHLAFTTRDASAVAGGIGAHEAVVVQDVATGARRVVRDPTLPASFGLFAHLLHDLLGEPQACESVRQRAGQFESGAGVQDVAWEVLTSVQYRRHVVDTYYRALLGRAAGGDEQDYWAGQLGSGLGQAGLLQLVAGSPEYLVRAGGSQADFVARAFQDVLGRPADLGGAAYWLDLIRSGALDRGQVARKLHESTEGSRRRVVAAYQRLLGRHPDGRDLLFWGELLRGNDDTYLERYLVSSLEYAVRTYAG